MLLCGGYMDNNNNFVYGIIYNIILEDGSRDNAKFILYHETACFTYGNCTTVHFQCGNYEEWIDTRYVVGILNRNKFRKWTYEVLRSWLRTTIKISEDDIKWEYNIERTK